MSDKHEGGVPRPVEAAAEAPPRLGRELAAPPDVAGSGGESDGARAMDRARRAEALAAVASALNAGRELSEVLRAALDQAVASLGGQDGAIFLLEPDGRLHGALEQASFDRTGIAVPPAEWPNVERVLADGASRHLTRAEAQAAERKWFEKLGIASAILAPLIVDGRRVGVLFVNFAEAPVASADDLVFADAIADQCAAAIDRAQVFEQAQAAEKRYRTLFARMADAVTLTDWGGHYLDANPAALRLTGYRLDELRLLRAGDLVVGEAGWAEAVRARLLEEGFWNGELEVRRRDGSMVPIEAWASLIRLGHNRLILTVARDISERQAFQRLQQEFFSSVTHDLKSPLTAIKGRAQLIRRQLARRGIPEDDPTIAGLRSIDESVTRMSEMLGELADIARLQLGQTLALNPRPTDLVALVRDVVADHAERTGRRLRFHSEAPELIGEWDASRLTRVFDNLVGNAIKYTPPGGEIDVTVRPEASEGAERAVVVVRDTGIGIPEADLPYVFERYHRASNVGRRTAGSGIGLAGACQIVRQHGVEIDVESREDTGSTFTVRLPLVAEAARPPDPE